jgi:hypothetical protein
MKSNERVERVNGLEIPSTVLVIIFCIGKGTPILAWGLVAVPQLG